MGTYAVIGESARVAGFALGGATVITATTPDDVRRAWSTLPAEVGVVVLTPEAAVALGPGIERSDNVLSVVMPS
jgi:vacuolar-type H+-ATPase subunit F/Vma7